MYSPHFSVLHFTIHVTAITNVKRSKKAIYGLGFPKKNGQKWVKKGKTGDNAYLPNRFLHNRSCMMLICATDRANNCLFARSVVLSLSPRNSLFLPFFGLNNFLQTNLWLSYVSVQFNLVKSTLKLNLTDTFIGRAWLSSG